MSLRRIGIAAALATSLSVALTAGARATDLYSVVEPVPATVAHDDAADWEGFYLAVFGGPYWETGTYRAVTLGKLVGYDWQAGDVVFGLRGSAWHVWALNAPFNLAMVAADARLGLPLGDRVLAYGFAGAGMSTPTDLFSPIYFVQGGGGLEARLAGNLGVFGEFAVRNYLTTSFCCGYDARAGLAWHFD